jgi:hypothetical protein
MPSGLGTIPALLPGILHCVESGSNALLSMKVWREISNLLLTDVVICNPSSSAKAQANVALTKHQERLLLEIRVPSSKHRAISGLKAKGARDKH